MGLVVEGGSEAVGGVGGVGHVVWEDWDCAELRRGKAVRNSMAGSGEYYRGYSGKHSQGASDATEGAMIQYTYFSASACLS